MIIKVHVGAGGGGDITSALRQETENACIRLIEESVLRNKGTLCTYTGGSTLAVFGAPVGHPNDLQSCLESALIIQQHIGELARFEGVDIETSIGIHTGSVDPADMFDVSNREITRFGDSTNIALELMTSSHGQILVSHRVFKEEESRFRLKHREDVKLNAYVGTGVYQLIGLAESGGNRVFSGAGLANLVGREHEVDTIFNFLVSLEPKKGRVLGVLGEPGMGKSRMAYEIRQMTWKIGLTYLKGSCNRYRSLFPFYPFQEALREAIGIMETDDPAIVQERIRIRLSRLNLEKKTHAETLDALAFVLGVRRKDTELAAKSPDVRLRAVRNLLVNWIAAEATHGPLVLVLDDLHWVDSDTLRVVQDLRALIQDKPISLGLVLILRPYPESLAAVGGFDESLRLSPLNKDDVELFCESMLLSRELPDGLSQFIHEKSRGCPFFVEELLKNLLEAGIVWKDDDGLQVGQDLALYKVSGSVKGVIRTRLNRLSHGSLSVLQHASVIGRSFPVALLKNVLEEGKEIGESMQQLQLEQFVFPIRGSGNQEYIFKHSLIQEVAYESIPDKERSGIHERVGSSMEKSMPTDPDTTYDPLIHHFKKSGNPMKESEFLLLEGKRLHRADTKKLARKYFERALELAKKLPEEDRLMLQLKYGAILWEVGDHDAARHTFRRAQSALQSDTPPAKTGS